jgi:hypothetical protein
VRSVGAKVVMDELASLQCHLVNPSSTLRLASPSESGIELDHSLQGHHTTWDMISIASGLRTRCPKDDA